MNWKKSFRSIYYDGAPKPADLDLVRAETALLIIDVQKTCLTRPDPASLSAEERRRYDAWTPFHERMHETVIPRPRVLCQHDLLPCRFKRRAHGDDGT